MLLIKICRKFVCPPAVRGSRFNASIRNFSAEHCMGSCREILVDFAGCNVTKIVVGCSSKEVQVCCYCLDCKQPTKSSQHFVHQRESSTEPWSTREHLITLGTSGWQETSGFFSKKQWHLGRWCRRSKLGYSAGAGLWPVWEAGVIFFSCLS